LAGLTLLLLGNCTTVKEASIPALPVEPEWVSYTRAPIIGKTITDEDDVNFVVTDEFVKKAAQEHRYLNKIKRWKVVNRVP
jgi:hypothetical protein